MTLSHMLLYYHCSIYIGFVRFIILPLTLSPRKLKHITAKNLAMLCNLPALATAVPVETRLAMRLEEANFDD